MKEPVAPTRDYQWFSQPTHKRTVLKTVVFTEDEMASSLDDFLENQGWEEEDVTDWEFKSLGYQETPFKLSDILRYSKGLNPDEIRVEIQRPRDYSYIMAQLVHQRELTEVEIKEWKIARDAFEAKYQEENREYLAKKKEYELYILQKEIADANEKLKKLRG